ncbi:hypothetical protein KIN20_025134 [Parelaphostrongylus tenuis]|uniref:Uncharacterized protein n=1 Tax=Parelaphostrongylus tenuis TaxID=148309 RepID=A0AAD5MUS5_PARTN|nr:hypothetical protein KIN20_025134 [Parelaphostrongylus tenuis]
MEENKNFVKSASKYDQCEELFPKLIHVFEFPLISLDFEHLNETVKSANPEIPREELNTFPVISTEEDTNIVP